MEVGQRYFRKVWEWWCWECRYRMFEEVVVDGKDRDSLICPVCGRKMDGENRRSEWAYEGCMTVVDV